MSDEFKGLDKARYWWYRALGSSDTQAQWRVRERVAEAPKARVHRHRNCDECGQLLLIEERTCHRCGATQLAPSWLVRLSKSFGFGAESIIPLLAGLCLFGYLAQISLGCSLFGGLKALPDPRTVLYVGAAVPAQFIDHLSPEYAWRLFAYTCIHGDLMHLGFNIIALIQIGPIIARTFGPARSLFIWVASGATAVLLPALLLPPQAQGVVIGASGAVFGFIGVAMAYGHRIGTPQGLYIRNKMIEWTVFCTLFGLMMGGIAHGAHFGGLIGGAALSFVLPPAKTQAQRALSPILVLSSLAFIGWSLWRSYQIYQLIS